MVKSGSPHLHVLVLELRGVQILASVRCEAHDIAAVFLLWLAATAGDVKECREPLGFRTNFLPSHDVSSDGPTGRHRSIQAEALNVALDPRPGTNLSLSFRPLWRTYKLNRGGFDAEANGGVGGWRGFTAGVGVQRLYAGRRNTHLTDQMIATIFDPRERRSRRFYT